MPEGNSYNLPVADKNESERSKKRKLADRILGRKGENLNSDYDNFDNESLDNLERRVKDENYSAELLNEILNYHPEPKNKRTGKEYEKRSLMLMELEWKYPKVIFDRQTMANKNLSLLLGPKLLEKYNLEVGTSKEPYKTEPISLESAVETLDVISRNGEHFENYRFGSLNTFISRSLHVLGRELDERSAIDIIISFISNIKGYLFRDVYHSLVDVLNRDAAYASSKLLPLLKDENPNLETLAGELLYRLEFGNVGISENGIRYLNKMYDLGKLNNLDYFAQRLTAKGDIGIFDNHRILTKYFNLGNLSGEDQLVKPEVMDFTYATLFFPKENETEEEKVQREKYLEEFKTNYFGFYNDDFFKKTKVRFNNLNFREQGWFLMYYKHADPENRQNLLDFAKKYREDGLKSFLSLEFGEDVGEKIMSLGQKLETWQAQLVFGKVAELADLANEEERGFQKLLTGDKGIDLSGIQLKLLEKAHKTILKFSESDNKNIEKLLEDLENSKIQIEILSALLKTAKENSIKLTPENIRDMKMEMLEVGELSGEEKAKFREKYEKPVMEMMRKSYAKIFAENPDARAKVENNFRERFENLEKYRVYVLMFQGEVVAFSVIDPNGKGLEEGEVMSESTIVHPDTQQGAMGIEFLKMIFEREFNEYKIKGIRGKVRAGHPAGESYDRIGLVVDKSHPTWVESGVEYESRVARKEPTGLETLNRQ
ncbi:MAG: N-acetyltransferase protein [Patescibacteria group bacterium]|nr:N-acetyltransferase protein [Patescibacteria group bacterium]